MNFCSRYKLFGVCCAIMLAFGHRVQAQNGMVGDGFGGRLWYKPSKNFGVGSYHGFSYCLDSGILFSWGWNNEKQFGTGTITSSNTPVRAKNISTIRFVSAGYCLAAITKNNQGWAWASTLAALPTKVIDSVKYAHGGSLSAQFIKEDGTVWAIGRNRFGMFGHDSFTGYPFPLFSSPVIMYNMSNAVRVTSTDGTLGVLKKDGTVWAVGSNLGGKLGIDSSNYNLNWVHPVQVKNLKKIVDLKSTQATFIALDDSGYVYTWGAGGEGAIGNGGTYDALIPERVKSLKDIVAVSACDDGYHFLALDKNKNCYGWGKNNFFYCGFFDSSKKDVLTPRLLDTDVIDIMAGEQFAYIVKSDGSLWAIGTNMGTIMPPHVRNYDNSIWMNLSDTPRYKFTKIEPTGLPMNLCKLENENISKKNKINFFNEACDTDTVIFVSEDSLFFAKYSWNFGDGTPTASGRKIKHHYAKGGEYTVRLISSPSGIGLSDTATKEINITNGFKAVMGISDTMQCDGRNEFVLTDLSQVEIKSREWNLSSLGKFTDSIVSLKNVPAGKYPVKLVLMNQFGCLDSMTGNFVVNPAPNAVIHLLNDTQCLEGNSFLYRADSVANTYNWLFYDGTSDNQFKATKKYTDTGHYRTILTVINKYGCVGSDTNVAVVIKASAAISVTEDTLCFKSQAFQFNTLANKRQYAWQTGDGNKYTLPGFNHSYDHPGTYKVLLHVSDAFGCLAADSVSVVVLDSIRAAFAVDQVPCSGLFRFTNRSVGNGSQWWHIAGETKTEKNISFVFQQTGTYTVWLVVADANGYCMDSVSQPVQVTSLFGGEPGLANVFTPGNDGFNDCYRVEGLDEACANSAAIEIFNRWGEVVFRGDMLSACWNGRVMNQGEWLPAGNYFYLLKLDYTDASNHRQNRTLSGTIVLIR